jgi:hypothetical protein
MRIFLLILLGLCSCGVKGNPQPPLAPPVLGRGEPSYSRATEGVKLKKKKAPTPAEPDWDQPSDFSEEPRK